VLAAGGDGTGALTLGAGTGSLATGSSARTGSFAGCGRNHQSADPSSATTTTAAAIVVRILDVFAACSSARRWRIDARSAVQSLQVSRCRSTVPASR
jgi:hypothetical protein